MFMVYFVDTHAAKYRTCILCAQVLDTNKCPGLSQDQYPMPGCDGSFSHCTSHSSSKPQTCHFKNVCRVTLKWSFAYLHQISCNTATKRTQIQGIHATTALLNVQVQVAHEVAQVWKLPGALLSSQCCSSRVLQLSTNSLGSGCWQSWYWSSW